MGLVALSLLIAAVWIAWELRISEKTVAGEEY